MQQVVTVNLGGKAIQLDQDAYEFLRAYLDQRASELHGTSDVDAALLRLERSIGKRCDRLLHYDKNVVTLAELQQVVNTLDGDATSSDSPSMQEQHGNRRALRQVSDGAIISGVCKGLAEYFDLNVTGIRIAFVVLAIFSSGGIALAYAVLMFLIPFDAERPPAMQNSVPAWMHNFVNRTKRAFSN
jgi:phage shock protein PspC (stress-responsive transcriptional regulator)